MPKRSKDKSSRRSKTRDRTPDLDLQKTLQIMLTRINSLEQNVGSNQSRNGIERGGSCDGVGATLSPSADAQTLTPAIAAPAQSLLGVTTIDLSVPAHETSVGCNDTMGKMTDRIVSAIGKLSAVRSNHIYISNFDPAINDIDVWCNEVDHVCSINCWDDRECLARIGNCLKGDAKQWLNEWVTNDRSWSNFKREFKPLCPRKVDVANILFQIMSTNSDHYTTYADYARRSLLRLRIVGGLSDELLSAIVLRGIVDPQIRAVATNAKLKPEDLVSFLSIYVKPATSALIRKPNQRTSHTDTRPHNGDHRKRDHDDTRSKYFSCGASVTNKILVPNV